MVQAQRPLTILYCGANAIDKAGKHLDLGKEFQAIFEAVEGSSFRLYPDYATSPSRLWQLLEQHKPAIVHFGLHGMRASSATAGRASRDLGAPEDPDGGLTLIENDGRPVVLSAAALQRMLKLCKRRTRCVVMSACHSEHIAEVLKQNIDHVVGMKATISDAGAIAFSGAFYRNLARNETFRESVEISRLALSEDEALLPTLFHRDGVSDGDRPRPVPWWVRVLGELEGLRALALATLLGVFSVVLLASGYGPLVSETREALMTLRHNFAPLQPSGRLRIALIDEQSVKALKLVRVDGIEMSAFGISWRALHARALDRLSAAGAKVVAVDIAFQDEPDKNSEAEIRGTAALAASIHRAAERGTHVVLTAMDREPASGQPRIAHSLRGALRATQHDGRCAIAHPCIGEPDRGPSVPLLPLVLEGKLGESPSFSLSLCAYALAQGTLPSWSPDTGEVFLARAQAATVASTLLERDPNVARCLLAREGRRAVQRVLAPFARDLVRTSDRVVPFEAVVGESELDVAGKIVLVGQRDLGPDIVLEAAAPDGKPLWGVSAHAAAIDAMLQNGGLMVVIPPVAQIAWTCVLCLLTLSLRARFAELDPRVRRGSVLLLGAVNAGACAYLAALHGLLTDPSNHLLAVISVYCIAGALTAHRQMVFA